MQQPSSSGGRLITRSVGGAASQAGVAWQLYGEQRAFWFIVLMRQQNNRTDSIYRNRGSARGRPGRVLHGWCKAFNQPE